MHVPFVDLKAQYAEIRSEIDAAIGAVIGDTAFVGGKYYVWDIRGHVRILVKRVTGVNAVMSGLFFGVQEADETPPSAPASLTATRWSAAAWIWLGRWCRPWRRCPSAATRWCCNCRYCAAWSWI